MLNNKKKAILLIFLIGRLVFIFFDGFLHKKREAENIVYFKNIGIEYQHSAAASKEIPNKEIEIESQISQKIQNNINNIKDLQTLKYIYKQNGSLKILKEIIKKQAQNYNFDEARTNIQKIEKEGDSIDIHLFLYVYLNSNNLNITQKDSIKKLPLLLDKAIQRNMLGNQDYLFYAGLIEIRNKNYTKAFEQRKQVKIPQYQGIISSFQKATANYDETKAIPAYYQDGLIALAALKNGYFTIAKKIALEITMQDDSYILPYQILSYSHFLTNNRKTAIEYFLKLNNFDKKNIDTYQFLIGASYFRDKDFSSSILYLSQNKNPKFQADILRYLIVSYLEIKDNGKLIETRQKLLNQTEINKSDFFLYFYNVFYKGYFSQNNTLYQSNKELSTLFIKECENKIGIDDDICVYGRIGVDIINNQLSPANEVELITLSESYNQSYFYHILGDMNKKNGKTQESKTRYAKTIASSQDQKEINFVQQKLSTF